MKIKFQLSEDLPDLELQIKQADKVNPQVLMLASKIESYEAKSITPGPNIFSIFERQKNSSYMRVEIFNLTFQIPAMSGKLH